ncbi:MAG: hypothetical protein GX234_07280 [Clostridiales bacterium]|nr:hypothetical protein [Clostridiales bacterium]
MLGNMMEAFRMTIDMYRKFSGVGMVTVFFLAALGYLWFWEKDKGIRMILVYLVTAVLVLFFFPVFSYLAIYHFLDQEVYYRFLWLMPMGVIVCYVIVRIFEQFESGKKRVLFSIVCGVMLMLQGSFIYSNPAVKRAENAYHLPQSVIDTADILHVEGDWVKAVVPSEMVQFIRQYDPKIMMPYGRDMLVESWDVQGGNREMYEAMEADIIHAQYLVLLCQQERVDYIVARKSSQIGGSFEEWGFMKIASLEEYDIYMDKHSKFYDQKREELGLD